MVKLELLDIFSGPEYYYKLSNGDELYSVTTVYKTDDVKGNFNIDPSESLEVKYFSVDELPEGLTEEYRSYIQPYIMNLVR